MEQRRLAERRNLEQDRRQRRRPLVIAGGAVVLVAVVAGSFAAFLPGEDSGAEAPPLSLTSELIEGATEPVTITSPPSEYRIVYRVDTVGDGATTTEEFTVQRPFNSVIASFEGEPPGGDPLWQATSNLGIYSTTTGAEGTPQVGAVAPSTALGDFRLDATLDDLVASGTYVAREQRRVLDRPCQVYRTGAPMETLQVAAPTEATYSDVCIDASGLLLEEMNVSDGSITSRMRAITLDEQLDDVADRFLITGEPLPVDQGGSELVPLDLTGAPVTGYWSWATPPAGYEHVGRYLLRDPEDATTDADQDEGGTTTTAPPPVIVESYADVYRAGANSIVVRQGPSEAQPNLPDGGATTPAGALGAVQTASGLTVSTVLAAPAAPAGWFVAVQATSPLQATVTLASTLQA